MAEVDLEKEIAAISEEKTGEGEAIETVLATPASSDSGAGESWLFRGWKITPMFTMALGENWFYRVYAEPYKPLWKTALKELEHRDSSRPVLIDLDIKYEWIENRRIAVHLRKTTIRDLDPLGELGALEDE